MTIKKKVDISSYDEEEGFVVEDMDVSEESVGKNKNKKQKDNTEKNNKKNKKANKSKEPKPKKNKKNKTPKKKKLNKKEEKEKQEKLLQNNDFKELITNYLESTNRPYSMLNITDNLKIKGKKQEIEKTLEELYKEDVIQRKEYGKNIIYWANQKCIKVDSEIIEKNKFEFLKLKEEFDMLNSQNKELTNTVKKVSSTMTNLELREGIKQLENRIIEVDKEADDYKNNLIDLKTKEDVDKLNNEFNVMEILIKKRVRWFNELINMLLEGSGMERKKLFKRLKIEDNI